MKLRCMTILYKDVRSALRNPWFIVAAVAFSASNRSEAVPRVFEEALQDLKSGGSDISEELMLARKMREALFKSGLISGYPKVIGIFAFCKMLYRLLISLTLRITGHQQSESSTRSNAR